MEDVKEHLSDPSLSWKTLPSPYSKRSTLPLLWSPKEFVNQRIRRMPVVQNEAIRRCTDQLLAQLQTFMLGTPIRIFYARLFPGDSILPHIDTGPIFSISRRCHLPILAPQGIQFFCSGATYKPIEGTWFEINNCALHSVLNTATTNRIHLIVDLLEPMYDHLLD